MVWTTSFANYTVTQILGSLRPDLLTSFRAKVAVFRRKQDFQEWEQKAEGLTMTGLIGPLVKDMMGYENARLFSNIFISKWKMRCLMTAWRSHRPLYLRSTDLHDIDFYVEWRKRRLDGRSFSHVFHFRFQYFYENDDRPGRSHWILIFISISFWSRNVQSIKGFLFLFYYFCLIFRLLSFFCFFRCVSFLLFLFSWQSFLNFFSF